MQTGSTSNDLETAQAFATSWNNLPGGSVYSLEQVLDWLLPLAPADFRGRSVIELGCGNASILVHIAGFEPSSIEGVDLGDSVCSAEKNLSQTRYANWKIHRGDLTSFRATTSADVVICIGVLHHLKNPQIGFESMLANTTAGGRFHGWVYAWEGNGLVRLIVEPIRKVACRLPWWLTKYGIATPLAIPTYIGALTASLLHRLFPSLKFPLSEYLVWLSRRNFAFTRHVVFDQLVTPSTVYIKKETIATWLQSNQVDQQSVYITFRNGNSWRFGGRKIF